MLREEGKYGVRSKKRRTSTVVSKRSAEGLLKSVTDNSDACMGKKLERRKTCKGGRFKQSEKGELGDQEQRKPRIEGLSNPRNSMWGSRKVEARGGIKIK